MEGKIRCLLIEDNPDDAWLVNYYLKEMYKSDFTLIHVDYLQKGIDQIKSGNFDVILTDITLPDSQGLNTFLRIYEVAAGVPVIVLTGLEDESIGMNAVRAGAQDFLIKGKFKSKSLWRSINYSIERNNLLKEISEHKKILQEAKNNLEIEVADRTKELNEMVILLAREIEQRKKYASELLRAKQTAEEAARGKANFLANMSHEIRTPLNAVLGILQLLEESAIPEELKKHIHNMSFATDNLLRIINDILELSRIDSGKIQMQEEVFNPVEIIEGLVNSYACLVNGKNIFLQTQLGPGLPVLLRGDADRLKQLLGNLLSNALKFTPEGSITVSVKTLKQTENLVTLCFAVSDTGIGIPAEKQKIIFDAFEQADAATARKYGGSGLGLSIVKRIVDAMGGDIEVDSKENSGTTFTVKLAFKPYSGKLPPGKELSIIQNAEDLKDLQVLVVEDNELNQIVITEFLKTWKIKAVLAPNGKAAVEKLKEQRFDLVIMDIQMPEMNGYETAYYIRNNISGPNQNVPILAMTAHAFKEEEEKCLKSGMDDYISKPIKKNLLFTKIHKLVK